MAEVNFGSFGPNPGEQLASAVGAAVADMPAQQAQRQQIGQQILAPYYQKLLTDPTNPQILARIKQISKQYGIPPLVTGGGTSPAGGLGTPGAAAPAPAQSGNTTPATTAAPGAAPSGQTPGGAVQTGPAKPMSFGGASPSGSASPQRWDDPRLQGRAQAYSALLHQAAENPSKLRDQSFHAQLIRAAAAVGRGPQEVKGDIAAYLQKMKAGVQPGAGHPAAAPQAGAPAGGAPAAGAAQPAQGAPAGATAPQSPAMATQNPAQQPQGGTAASPAPAPGETQGYMNPSAASEGPERFDVNAYLGPLSLQDFSTLSGMTPDERIAALRQQGRDLNGFDQKWLHSEPSLSPSEQITIAHDAASALTADIKNGATPDQVKLSVSTYRPYLTPAQNAELDSNIKDSLDHELQIRQAQVTSTGFLRGRTLDLMNRRLGDSEKNTAWDHDFRYTVLNDKNAQWSTAQATRQQNANTQYSRYQEEFSRDQANGLVDDQGRPIKGGGGIKPGEMINTARGLLTSIQSAVHEYNTTLQTALQNPGKGGGVNAPMEADIQNQIDAYNQIVDQMDARGMHYFKHYTGPDQSALQSNTAAATAGSAVGSQGQSAGTPTDNTPPFTAPPGWTAKKINGHWAIVQGSEIKYWQGGSQ
jgi:hypothetical protein